MREYKNAWTPEEDIWLRDNYKLYTDEELGQKLGRTRSAVYARRYSLGLTGKPGKRQKEWTERELEYLRDRWGERTIPEIAKSLGRSVNAVKIKSVREGLVGQIKYGDMMSARKVSEMLGVDIHAVTDYCIPKCELPAKKKRRGSSKQKTTIIMFSDLLLWLETHQNLWDSRRIEPYGLGVEYEWLREKRKKDALLPPRRAQKWTLAEDRRAIDMYRMGKTYQEIGDMLGRSACSVEHRIMRLDVWGTGKFISDNVRQQQKQQVKDNYERKILALRLCNTLKAYRNSMEFGEYWQKDMCQHWDT